MMSGCGLLDGFPELVSLAALSLNSDQYAKLKTPNPADA